VFSWLQVVGVGVGAGAGAGAGASVDGLKREREMIRS